MVNHDGPRSAPSNLRACAGTWPSAASLKSTVSVFPKLRRGRCTRDIGRAIRPKQSPFSWRPSGTCSPFALVSMHFASFTPTSKCSMTPGLPIGCATLRPSRPTGDRTKLRHRIGIKMAYSGSRTTCPRKSLAPRSSGIATKSGQLSAMGGLYGNNERARICPRCCLGKGASR